MNTEPLNINQYEAADMLLEFIDKPEHHNQMFAAENIQEKLFPTVDIDTIQYIFEMIEHSYFTPQIAKFESGVYIYRTVGTTPFLKNGGFTKLHRKETLNNQRTEEAENLELQQLRTSVKLLTNQLIDYDKTKSQAKLAIIISVLLLISQVLQWLWPLITKKQ